MVGKKLKLKKSKGIVEKTSDMLDGFGDAMREIFRDL